MLCYMCAADVPKGKPSPDIFIEAARRIGCDPRQCRAYEDGESGLVSAYDAGCHVIDVTYMHEYPSCDGLRQAKEAAARSRTWLRGRSVSWMLPALICSGVVLIAAYAAARASK